jgi:hypothetical protein
LGKYRLSDQKKKRTIHALIGFLSTLSRTICGTGIPTSSGGVPAAVRADLVGPFGRGSAWTYSRKRSCSSGFVFFEINVSTWVSAQTLLKTATTEVLPRRRGVVSRFGLVASAPPPVFFSRVWPCTLGK